MNDIVNIDRSPGAQKYTYLLINPVEHDPTDEAGRRGTLEAMAKARPPKVFLIDDPFIDRAPERRLRLYAIEQNDPLWKQSLSWVESVKDRESLCGWLYGDCTLSMLGRHLQRLMRQQLPDGDEAVLQYFDPKILHHLSLILKSEQLEALMGPLTSWHYIDGNGRKVELKRPNNKRIVKFWMTPTQWRSIERYSAINLCLRAWKENIGEALLPYDASLQAEYFIALAETYGIQSQTDLIAFVLHGLGTSPAFHRHPIMIDILSRFGRGESGYLSLTDNVTAQDWSVIGEHREREVTKE